MQIVKLNCTACGAPISIPEDIDILFCTSCGSKLAVDRGDGFISLKLVEKITQAIQESGDKAHSAIRENTYVTKVELKRVQISQSVNTEEMKLNTIRQEIRSLARKPQLLPIELQQLTTLRLDECNTLMRIRKFNMDSAKLEEGWDESLETFQADLVSLTEIIDILTPFGSDPIIGSRLNMLIQERPQCENHLTALETRLLTRQLKSLKYAPLTTLTVEELEKLSEDLQSDLNLLVNNPQTVVKTHFRTELNVLQESLNAVYPRKKVESATGILKSLDLKPPFPEIPWQLIPLIELAESDLEKVRHSPDNPSKILIKNEIINKSRELKTLQSMDLPSQRVLAQKKRKNKRKTTRIMILIMAALVLLIVILARIGSQKVTFSSLSFLNNPPKNPGTNITQPQNDSLYQAVETELFEVVAQKTYLRQEPNIASPELDQIVHGELLVNLGQSQTEADWYQIQNLSGDLSGYLYQQWISPIHGKSIQGETANTGNSIIFSDDFSGVTGTWYEDSFDDDFGQGRFVVSNGAYQVDLNAIDGGYIYSKIDLNELPPSYVFSLSEKLVLANGSSAAGLITNFVDENNFDYFLLISDGTTVIGCRRNGENNSVYNTLSTPNNWAAIKANQKNQLSVWVESAPEGGPNHFTYAVNGKSIYSLIFETPQKYSPVIGMIIWSMDANQPVTYTFDDVTVTRMDN